MNDLRSDSRANISDQLRALHDFDPLRDLPVGQQKTIPQPARNLSRPVHYESRMPGLPQNRQFVWRGDGSAEGLPTHNSFRSLYLTEKAITDLDGVEGRAFSQLVAGQKRQ